MGITVGKGEDIKGFDEGIAGMKIGETKTLTIPPEKSYIPSDPGLIQVYPLMQVVPSIFPMVFPLPVEQFEETFGKGHKVGDIVTIPRTTINTTVKSIGANVSLSYNFNVGDQLPSSGAPWNTTVVKIDDTNADGRYT